MSLVQFVLNITQNMGYGGIVFLMALESSLFPLPSEIVIPPAAYLAQQGVMNLWLIIIAGTIGSVLGASFNYCLGYFLGRPLFYKLANYRWARYILFITPDRLKKAEDFFLRYDKSATFIGRLVPVVRHLISIPAGFSKMNFFKFILLTFLGSAVWVSILAVLGYVFGANKELMFSYYKEIYYGLLILGALFVVFVVIKRRHTWKDKIKNLLNRFSSK
jgi:membrane protein DedA with SNARE-associated domain